MSRRRRGEKKPDPNLIWEIKVGCTGRETHKKLIFDTVWVWDDSGQLIIGHGKSRRGPHVEASVPDPIGAPAEILAAIMRGEIEEYPEPPVDYYNHPYRCPLCGLDYPIRAKRDSEIFGPLRDARVPFLDLSALRRVS